MTGGVDKTSCFKTLARELISGAIAAKKDKVMSEEDLQKVKANKRKKFNNSCTENTLRGSDGLSAERRLTKRTRRDETEEEMNKIKILSKNIQLGSECLENIKNLKQAQEALTQANVPIQDEYWEINPLVEQKKLKIYLKLWFFPHGGGKLTKTKTKQLEALQQFNLTRDGVNFQINECTKKLIAWKKELQNSQENHEDEINNEDKEEEEQESDEEDEDQHEE